MIRPRFAGRFAWLLCLLLLGGAPALGQGAAPSAAPAPATPPPVSTAELQRLVDTLQNDAARGHLVAELKALIAVERGDQQQGSANPLTFLQDLSQQVDDFIGEILDASSVVVDAPRLVGWVERQATDDAARRRWLEIGLHLTTIFGLAVLADWIVARCLWRPRRRLAAHGGHALPWRIVLTLLAAALDMLPILAFAGAAHGVMALPFVHPGVATGHVAQVLIWANVLARLIMVGCRVALLADPSPASLLGLGEETRNYLYIWARRFTNWAVYGFAVPAGAWWLGIPGSIYALLLKGAALVLTVLAIIFILQNRGAVAEWLRGRGAVPGGAGILAGAAGGRREGGRGEGGRREGWRLLRRRLADIWHVLTILYILGIFVVYTLRISGGFIFVLRATLLSLVVLTAARLLVRFVHGLSRRGFAIGGDLKQRFPTLEKRANRYLPILTLVSASIIYLVAALAFLQAWGIESFAWLTSSLGRQVTGSLIKIATVVAAAVFLWELFSAAIERYLAATDGNGQVARSARTRTLLPLLRTAMLVVLLVAVALIILSDLGINTAPLLAGAGVVGLAIGFGSQALVKDVITGLFILIEDTLAVGDVVDVGKGHVGVVEAISIRTIRLRDMSATVHTIPFSEVTTINNMTRGYAYFVANVGVLYREDPDRVMALLREIGEDLRADPEFGRLILEPLDVVGVDRFTDTAMVILVRLKTQPLKQWTIGREFNRRLKKTFDAHGIEMPAMNQTRYLPDLPEPRSDIHADMVAKMAGAG